MEWVLTFGGPREDYVWSMNTEVSGNVVLVGSFSDSVDFDPGPGFTNLYSANVGVFIQKLDPEGNLIWAKAIDGPSPVSQVIIAASTIDPSGSIYLTGKFRGKIDFDPGPDTFSLLSTRLDDVFIVKLDSTGKFLWANSVGGSSFDAGSSLVNDDNGNVYISGRFSGTADFDPGPDTFNLSSIGNQNAFILKIDSEGKFVWAKSMEGLGNTDEGDVIRMDAFGDLYIGGWFQYTADFDPGPDSFKIASKGAMDGFIQKIDSLGNFIWAKSIGGIGDERVSSIETDDSGNIYSSGIFHGTVDFDPGPDSVKLTASGNYARFIQKLNRNGQFVWVKLLSGLNHFNQESITLDGLGNIYRTGQFGTKQDFDPGETVFNLTNRGQYDAFIQKLDTNGNFIWAKSLGSASSEVGTSIVTDTAGNVYVGGYFGGTVDVDPGFGLDNRHTNGSYDNFIIKLKHDSCSDFYAVYDSISDITCLDSAFISIHPSRGDAPYSFNWNSSDDNADSIHKTRTPGINTVVVKDSVGCSISSSLLINGPYKTGGFDLKANLIATPFRTGRAASIWLNSLNTNCDTVSGRLTVVLDSNIQFDSASISPNRISGDTLVWIFKGLNFDSQPANPRVFLKTSRSAKIGEFIQIDLMIDPTEGDNDTVNNKKRYRFPVVNSYDPNDKKVFPTGKCKENYVIKSEPLTYTVRFQNTGNAEAIDVYVLDKIDSFLDMSTLKVTGQSHENLITEILPNNMVRFRFDNIYLADSFRNEKESHGYIVYEITPLTNLPNGTVIRNQAEIYFDFNKAIITNSVFNTLTDSIPVLKYTDVRVACNSFTWIDGKTYTASNNSASYIYKNTGDCDSTVTLDLTIYKSNAGVDLITACDSYTWIDGITYTTSNTSAKDTLANVAGCDSIVTLNLTIDSVNVSLTVTDPAITSNADGANYQWLDCDKGFAIINGETNKRFTASKNGNYSVEVRDKNCTDTSVCVSISTIGINDSQLFQNVSIYPNPNQGSVKLDLGPLRNVSMKVFSSTGQLMYQHENINSRIFQFELPPIKGVYSIELISPTGKYQYKLLME
jgi:hypothetical protein